MIPCTFCMEFGESEEIKTVDNLNVIRFICQELKIDFDRAFSSINEDPLDLQSDSFAIPLCTECEKLFVQVGRIQVLLDQVKTKLKKILSEIKHTIVNSPRMGLTEMLPPSRILRTEVILSTVGKRATALIFSPLLVTTSDPRLVSVSPTVEPVVVENQNVIRNLEAASHQSFVHQQEVIEVIEVNMEDIEIIEPEVTAAEVTPQEINDQSEETEETRQLEIIERVSPTDSVTEMTEVIENVEIKTEALDTYVEEDVELFNNEVVDEEQQFEHMEEEIEIVDNHSSENSNPSNSSNDDDIEVVEEAAEPEPSPVSVQKNAQIDNSNDEDFEETAEPLPTLVQNVQIVHVDSQASQVKTAKLPKPRGSSVMKNIEMDPEIVKKMEEQLGTDGKDAKFICEFCGSKKRIFTGVLSLNVHIQNFHNTATIIYTCPEPGCDRIFPVKTMLDHHSKSHYSEEIKRPHKCPEPNCLMRFEYLSIWENHIKRHKRQCRFCEFASVPSTNIRSHEVTEHSDQLNHICDKCGEIYSSRAILESHLQIHETDGPYVCSICKMALSNEIFLNGDELETHLISCHVPKELKKSKLRTPNALNCTICDEHFLKHSQLKQHIKQLHHTEGKTPQKTEKFKCKICSKEYNDKRYMKMHMAIHADDMALNNREPKTCSYCGVQFLSARLLKNHKIVKHYKISVKTKKTCNLCGKVMASGHYTIHMRIHAGIKPFSCYFCNKTFFRYDELNFHLRSNHTMERPFVCTICSADYNHLQSFNIHMNTHYRRR